MNPIAIATSAWQFVQALWRAASGGLSFARGHDIRAFSDELADKRWQLAEIEQFWRATSMVLGPRNRGQRPPSSTDPVLVVDQFE